jgi:hypothetical protein
MSWRLRKGGCEGQEVKQSEGNGSQPPQPRLGEYWFIPILKNGWQII